MPSNPPRDENGDDPKDPFQEMFERLLGGAGGNPGAMPGGMPMDPQSMGMMFQQIQSMMSSGGSQDPVNWELARNQARQIAVQNGDPSVTDKQRGAVADAMKLAELWVGQATNFAEAPVMPQAWSRSEWIEETATTWKAMSTPVAESVSAAMTDAMVKQMPPEIAQLTGGADLSGMLGGAGSMMFGMQLGQAVGGLSCEVLSSTDIGLPLAPGKSALVPSNIVEFSEGLELPTSDVMLYLAIREAAHLRLFHGVPWLRDHVLGLITTFAEGIHIDMDRIESIARELDPSDPQGIQDAMASGVFSPQMTPEQESALRRLETALALIEGWVHHVTVTAGANITSADALTEMMSRRRAEGGPAERTFGSLVGLELRPRRLREAAAFWEHMSTQRGVEERDSLWESAELLPTDEDLDDPAGFEQRRGLLTASDEEMDAALARLLSGGYDDAEGTSGESSGHAADDTAGETDEDPGTTRGETGDEKDSARHGDAGHGEASHDATPDDADSGDDGEEPDTGSGTQPPRSS